MLLSHYSSEKGGPICGRCSLSCHTVDNLVSNGVYACIATKYWISTDKHGSFATHSREEFARYPGTINLLCSPKLHREELPNDTSHIH